MLQGVLQGVLQGGIGGRVLQCVHMCVWLDVRNVTALKYQSGVLQRVAVSCSGLQCVFTLLRMRVCGRMHTM